MHQGGTSEREQWLAETFAEITAALNDDFDLLDLLETVVSRCARYVDPAQAGMVLGDRRGKLRPMAASSEQVRIFELFEAQHREGPCHDAYVTGSEVLNQHLDGPAATRWPTFASNALNGGFTTVHALPVRCRGEVVGSLNVFQVRRGELARTELDVLRAMAAMGGVALVHHAAAHHVVDLGDQLTELLRTRIALEQAKGVLAEREGIDIDAAHRRLGELARQRGCRPLDVAAELLYGRYTGGR